MSTAYDNYAAAIQHLKRKIKDNRELFYTSGSGVVDLVDVRNHIRAAIGQSCVNIMHPIKYHIRGLNADLNSVINLALYEKRAPLSLHTLTTLVDDLIHLHSIPKKGVCNRLFDVCKQLIVSPQSIPGAVLAWWSSV